MGCCRAVNAPPSLGERARDLLGCESGLADGDLTVSSFESAAQIVVQREMSLRCGPRSRSLHAFVKLGRDGVVGPSPVEPD
jgi:hypothetical protein